MVDLTLGTANMSFLVAVCDEKFGASDAESFAGEIQSFFVVLESIMADMARVESLAAFKYRK